VSEENVKLILSLYPAGDPDWVQLIHSISERVLVLNNECGRREGSAKDVRDRRATLWTMRDGKASRLDTYARISRCGSSLAPVRQRTAKRWRVGRTVPR
jgi:hypothetical protein